MYKCVYVYVCVLRARVCMCGVYVCIRVCALHLHVLHTHTPARHTHRHYASTRAKPPPWRIQPDATTLPAPCSPYRSVVSGRTSYFDC